MVALVAYQSEPMSQETQAPVAFACGCHVGCEFCFCFPEPRLSGTGGRLWYASASGRGRVFAPFALAVVIIFGVVVMLSPHK